MCRVQTHQQPSCGPDEQTWALTTRLADLCRRDGALSAMDQRVLADPIEPGGGSCTGPSTDYQRLNLLIDRPAAYAAAPVLVKRLLRLREARRAGRIGALT
jgi:hypothetical protein